MGAHNSAASLLFVLVVGIFSLLYFRGRAPQNHYEALGLYRSATAADIKSQFRRVALRYHPDKNPGDETAISRFHALVEARDVLLDPEKRRAYDEQLDAAKISSMHQERRQQQQQRQQQQHRSSFFNRKSWDCESLICWWLTYLRDTLYPYFSLWGICALIFYLGIGTVVSEWLIPKIGWLVQYMLCHCLYERVLRTNASRKAQDSKETEMRARMRERWASRTLDSKTSRKRK